MPISPSLVADARTGDADTVTDLLRAAWPAGYRIARSILADHAAAEDAAQDACATVVRTIGTLRRARDFEAWFYRIVVNEARQRLRKTAREVPLDALPDAGGRLPAAEPSVADRIDVRRAIDALDPALRATVILSYYFGMSGSEIGTIMSTSAVTSRWRLMVARRKLRALLDPVRALPHLERNVVDARSLR